MPLQAIATRGTQTAVNASFIFRRYKNTPEEAKEIVTFFSHVLSEEKSVAEWEWRYTRNPYSTPILCTAQDRKSGKMAGHYAVIPLQLNVNGKPRLIFQATSALVDPQSRRQGLFEAMAEDCQNQSDAAKMALGIAFPGEMSYPGFIGKLGWQRVGVMKRFSQRLSIAKELLKFVRLSLLASFLDFFFRSFLRIKFLSRAYYVGKRLPPGVQWKETKQAPEGIQPLWEHLAPYQVLGLWKDAQYFRWRYDAKPQGTYRYFFLSENNEITALAVVHEDAKAKTAELCEFLIVQHDTLRAERLLTGLVLKYLDAKFRTILFCALDEGFSAQVFQGFETRLDYTKILCVRVSAFAGELKDLAMTATHWTLSLGDTDHL